MNHSNLGPSLGDNLVVTNGSFGSKQGGGVCRLPQAYKDGTGKGASIFAEASNFAITELEVFEIVILKQVPSGQQTSPFVFGIGGSSKLCRNETRTRTKKRV